MAMQIRGAIIQARKTFVETSFGQDAWERLLEMLPESDQSLLRGVIISAGWYAFETGERLDKAIVEHLARGSRRVIEDIGAESARKNLSGIHKPFLSPGNPQEFMAQANAIYRFYYDVGYRDYEKTGPFSGVMTTYDAETFSELDCLTVVGWYREGLKMCGASEVNIVEEQCRAKGDPFCRYRISWKMD